MSSFEERVIKKTNDLIIKYGGNLKRFKNGHIFTPWITEQLVVNDLLVGKLGENYEELYLIRTTKVALKKNKPRIQELNTFLRNKRNSMANIDELANFIGFLVTKTKPIATVTPDTSNPKTYRISSNTKPSFQASTKKSTTYTTKPTELVIDTPLPDSIEIVDTVPIDSIQSELLVDSWEDL